MAARRNTLSRAIALALTFAAVHAHAQQSEAERLDEVVVTAQGREQELKDVPIAVQVVDDALIRQIAADDLGDLDAFVPGLDIGDGSPTQPRFAIRGIRTDDFGVGTDPAVGVYVDGVYAARSGGALLAFNDVERIEVLKGPQGTLFGRNSAAGAIALVTRKPGDAFEGEARVRFGNYGAEYASGLLNAPVADGHALRVSALRDRSDGWLDDDATGNDVLGDDAWAGRFAWRSRLTDATTLDLSWDHEEIDQRARPAIGLIDLAPYPALPAYPPDPSAWLDPLDAPLFNDAIGDEESRTFDGITLQIDHSFDWGNLLATTAVREFETLNREDEDGTNRINLYFDTANIEDNRSVYQEFRFNGIAGDVDWVAGASWYREDADQTSATTALSDSIDTLIRNVQQAPTPDGSLFSFLDAVLQQQGIPLTLLGHRWTESMVNHGEFRATALFGDAIWHVTDRLNVTFGLRYTRDEKEFAWFNGSRVSPELDATIAALAAAGFFDAVGLPPQALLFDVVFDVGALEGQRLVADDHWSDFSPRFVVDYALNDDTMVFGSLAKGYKAGGYNSVQPGSYFDNEDVWNAEVGLKTALPASGLAFNGSVFRYVYDNRQAIRLDPNTAGSGIPRYLVDTSDEQAWGIDGELHWQVSDAFELRANAAFIDATYDEKTSPSGADLSGDPTGEPHLSAAFGGSYTWALDGAGDVRLSLLHAYRGRSRCNDDSALQGDCGISPNFDVGRAQNRTDVRLQWTSGDGRWGVGVYGNNVFDERYVTGVNNITTSVFGTPFASVSEPRFYGAEVEAHF